MLAMAHIKQGKGEMFPRNSQHTNLSPALTQTDGRAVRLHMSRIHGKMEICVNHGKAAQKALIEQH